MKNTVLVVDDDPDSTFLLSSYLERAGFAARIANSLREAKTMLEDEAIRVVLCDRNLGDGEGLGLFEGKRPPWIVWAVILSGERTAGEELAAAGFDAMLEKPFDALKLVGEVKAKLR